MKHSLEPAPDGVSRETQQALQAFVALVLRWNRSVNLVSANDKAKLWTRHIADSLQLLPLMQPRPTHAIDLGSGGGFPGLVLALATGVSFDLIEVDQRKAAFLREAARITGAPVRIHPVRIETANLPRAPLITARALAPMSKLLDLAQPLLAQDGTCLFMKGVNAAVELTDAAAQWHMQVDRIASRTAPNACILRISHLSRVVPCT